MSDTTKDTAQDPMLPQIVDGVVHVALVLAHPLSKKDLENCRAVEKGPAVVGDVIHVTREWGHALIEGARVQIDPANRAAVQSALYLNKRDRPLTSTEFAKAVETYVEAATADKVTGETASQKKIRELEEQLAAAQEKLSAAASSSSEPASDAAGQTPGETGDSDNGDKPGDPDPGVASQARTEAPARGARAGKSS